MSAIVAERGQVTIPTALRDKVGIVPGTVLEFAAQNGRRVATKGVDEHPALKLMGRHGKRAPHRRHHGRAARPETITAVDTNGLIDVLAADPEFGERSASALARASRDGALIACHVAWPAHLEADRFRLESVDGLELSSS